MKENAYEMPWRTNYEAMAAAGWLVGATGAIAAEMLTELPPEPFWWMTGISSGMALYRLPEAYRLHKLQKGLKGKPLAFMELSHLQKVMAKHPDELWLGYGFEWDQRHAQRAYEILKRDKQTLLNQGHGKRMGSTWIHGVEPKEEDVYQPVGHTEGHTLIVGTTGAGKTRCFDAMITQAILRNEAVIIIDPKGDKELKDNAQRACIAAGSPERFVYFHPGFPEHSVRLNPLRNFNRGTEIASRIAALIPSETGADPFKAFGQMALNNIVQGLLLTSQRPDLKTLRRFLEGGPEGLVVKAVTAWGEQVYPNFSVEIKRFTEKANTLAKQAMAMLLFYYERIQPVAANTDLEGLLSMFEHDRTHYSKMVASLMPVLNMLTSSELGPLLSPIANDVDDSRLITDSGRIINNAQVAYIGLDSLTDAMVGSAIGSLLLSDLTAVAGDRYNYGVENRPVNIFIDEAAEVVNDPFIQLLNKGRGAKMRCVIATQTFADFSARTGSEAKARQVLGNINNLIALRVMDAETQQYITDNLPKTRLQYIMQTQGMSSNSDSPALFTGNHGERLMEEEGDMFPPQLLGHLPNLEYIAKLSGGRVIKGRIPILTSSTQAA
ncbi:MAG: conjugative transfer system coupling protein TraD [Cycloclasticus sp.]|uniref:conjugative transfer system coupling protein TraD n=1 Tax=Cycloclasticus sp. TaxID=2024830 RepID=UPI00257E24E3|nr:conjugative transfer system coupling protein TraD [Cycloclasticus sp.]MBV1899300.1 conjugative transfer system coupling protein TraD [Cycloclasticus sp.]